MIKQSPLMRRYVIQPRKPANLETQTTAMEAPNLVASSSQAPRLGRTNKQIHAFVGQSTLRPFVHTFTFSSDPKRAAWKPSPLASTHSLGSMGMLGPGRCLPVSFATPYVSDPFCTAADCPLSACTHYKGFYLHEATSGRAMKFQEDFGWSDPPPFLLAAYCRATACFDELHANERAKEIFVDGLMENLYLDREHDDGEIVKAFLRYHAVTLRVIGGRYGFVPLIGPFFKPKIEEVGPRDAVD
ncbi:MAG: hypothetical protein Q9207_004860 [Kuettlingeria erythrocarpa]